MPKLMVKGKRKLEGKIKISGAKNAVLPQMAASLLTSEEVTLTNVPNITDVRDMKKTLRAYALDGRVLVEPTADDDNSSLKIKADSLTSSLPETNAWGDIRASFLVLGPLLARTGKAEVYKPGGCKLQKRGRKVDFHIQAMEAMGAKLIEEDDSVVKMKAKDGGLKPGTITFKKPSVGATETAMMAASLVQGKTVIRNAAVEPEIYDLKEMLKNMGANITIEELIEIEEGITDFGIEEEIKAWNVITVTGRNSLNGVEHRVMPDRIEFGTYAIAAAMTNGKIILQVEEDRDIIEWMLKPIRNPLNTAGVEIEEKRNSRSNQFIGIEFSLKDGIISPVDIKTGPYPEFPTDLLPQWVAFMTQVTGNEEKASIYDKIYDNRFKYVEDLKKMKAVIEKIDKTELTDGPDGYCVYGGHKLTGIRVEAPDLRGGAALVLAGLVAQGSTVVRKFENIQRGYEDMIGKLNRCGAKLELLSEPRRGHYGGQ